MSHLMSKVHTNYWLTENIHIEISLYENCCFSLINLMQIILIRKKTENEKV